MLCRRTRQLVSAFIAVCAMGCSVPIARDLDESAANQAVVALEHRGVHATKDPDPTAEGRWQVQVAREDASAAVEVLTEESLPPDRAPGVLDALGEGAIVPSRTAEHAKLIAGIAGELERSLRSVDGVLSVRVHLAVPEKDRFADESAGRHPSASVLIRHRGATPPLAAEAIQNLIAGAVPELAANQVAVVATPVPDKRISVDSRLARFGPITVTRGSMTALKLAVGILILVNAGLVVLVLGLWARFRRTSSALAEFKNAEEATAPKAR